MRSQRGQGLLEAVIGTLVFIAFVSSISFGFYAIWVKQRLSELAYEALICQETREERFCYQQFRRQIREQIPFGRVTLREQTKSSTESVWIIDYEQKPVSFSVRQSIKLPLR